MSQRWRKKKRKRTARSLQYPVLSCKSVRSPSPPSGMVTYVKAGYTPRDEWTLFYALLLFNSLASLLHSLPVAGYVCGKALYALYLPAYLCPSSACSPFFFLVKTITGTKILVVTVVSLTNQLSILKHKITILIVIDWFTCRLMITIKIVLRVMVLAE